MDTLTALIKTEISNKYGTLANFSKKSGIPYSTLANALIKGVGGTGYNTVLKICDLLGIKQANETDRIYFNDEFKSFYEKLTELDKAGIHTVCTVLNVEYRRVKGLEDPEVRGLHGIEYAVDKPMISEEELAQFVRKAKKKNRTWSSWEKNEDKGEDEETVEEENKEYSTVFELRTSHALSQDAFGKLIGVTAVSVAAYEKGRRFPSKRVARKIHEVFGVWVPTTKDQTGDDESEEDEE